MSNFDPRPVKRLSAGDPAAPGRVVGNISLSIDGEAQAFEIAIPGGPVSPDALLPVFQGLVDAVVDAAVRRSEAAGAPISCRAGCGACCRQLVPISELEARALADLVARMPEAVRGEVQARFAGAGEALQASGLRETLDRAYRGGDEDLVELGLAYFRLGVPCPFLRDEACAIHPDRPLACREFLVTSPAAHCADPSPETVRVVEMTRLSRRVDAVSRQATQGGWVALTDALDFAVRAPAGAAERSGPEILHGVVAKS
jgi:Fe-S-cluster containining protein